MTSREDELKARAEKAERERDAAREREREAVGLLKECRSRLAYYHDGACVDPGKCDRAAFLARIDAFAAAKPAASECPTCGSHDPKHRNHVVHHQGGNPGAYSFRTLSEECDDDTFHARKEAK